MSQDQPLWVFVKNPDPSDDSFELQQNSNTLEGKFIEDGLRLKFIQLEPSILAVVQAISKAYQDHHQKFHKNSKVTFNLLCNTEEEARFFIQNTHDQFPLTSLKFFSKNFNKIINKNSLLESILTEHKEKRPSRPSNS
ncbi:MAG TPA: hypothetical protein VFP93_01685, partial [Gammaproteobacteria bacterium]|nr:hypothetical protein [Gammaproteobacteria bacterium]